MSIIGLAPMDGFTDCAFRQIVKEIFEKYWEKDKYELILWTEFMNADGYIINPIWVVKHLLTSKEQSPVIAQIFWGNEEMLLKCFSDIQNKYSNNPKSKIQNPKFHFSWLELNMGCPARNVMNTWWGSALLKDKETTLAIIKKLSWIMEIPLSIKTRTGIDDNDKKNQMKFLVEVSTYVNMITIHWRTVKQGYSWDTDWEFIYKLRDEVQGKRDKEHAPHPTSQSHECKVIWNWGIHSYEDIEAFTGNLDWVMIGQSAVGNPRIFTPHIPSREEIKETVLKHLEYMISYENFFQNWDMEKLKDGNIMVMPTKKEIEKYIPKIKNLSSKSQALRSIPEFRKHLFQYVKWIPWSKEFKQKVSTITEYKPLVKEIQKFFDHTDSL